MGDGKKEELENAADQIQEAGGEAMGGMGMGGFSGPVTIDTAELEQRIDKVEAQIKEMSRNVAKKLSLMIDLMMSLSDQVSSVNSMPNGPGGGGGGQMMPVVR